MSNNMNVDLQNAEFRINHGDLAYAPMKVGSQITRRSKRSFKGVYDFNVQGGAIGAISLYDPVFGKMQPLYLPASLIITDLIIDCTVALAGAGATVALSSGVGAGDLLAATAYNAVPFTGVVSYASGTSGNLGAANTSSAIKVPATTAVPGSLVTATVAGAALTAGQFIVHLEGFLSDLL